MIEVKTIPFLVSNAYVVKENGKTLLIDAGCYTNLPGFCCTLAMNGVMPNEIDLIVLTHGHFDHAGGIHHAKTVSGAPILAHEGSQEFLHTGKFDWYVARNAMGQAFIDNIAGPAPLDAPEPTDIDIPITEDTDLTPYGFSAKVLLTPGHTMNSVSVVFDSGEAFTGDTILDPFGEGVCTFAALSPDTDALKATGKKLLDAGAQTFYSGHGGPFSRERVEEAYRKLIESNE